MSSTTISTWLVSRLHYPSLFEPIAIVTGTGKWEVSDDALAICERRNRAWAGSSHSVSDTEWTEISVMGNRGTDQEYDILYSGPVTGLAQAGLPCGEYTSCYNPRDLREPAQTWRVWLDRTQHGEGVMRAGHRHI